MRHSKSRSIKSRSACLLSACRSPDTIGENSDISGDARRVGTGAARKPNLPFSRLVGTVSNCADAVRLEILVTIYRTAPTGGRKGLFIFRIHHNYKL